MSGSWAELMDRARELANDFRELLDERNALVDKCASMQPVVKAACEWSIAREADHGDECLERLDVAAQAYIKHQRGEQ